MSDAHIGILSLALRDNRSILKLDLSNNQIGDVGVAALLESWREDPVLQHLNLQHNLIGPSGAQCLLQTTASFLPLDELNLSHNTSIGFEGLQLIGDELLHSRLRTLPFGICFSVGE